MIQNLEVILPSVASIISIGWAIVSSMKASKEAKETERLRTELNQKNHVKDSLFDYEFNSYIRLMGLLNSMVDCNLQLFPHIARKIYDEEEDHKRRVSIYESSVESRNKFILALGETRPFIDEKIYNRFSSIQVDCMSQIILYEDFMLSDRRMEYRKEEKDEFRKAFDNQERIVEEYNSTSLYIKEYLSNYYSKTGE